jgi:hypothetical protein
VFSLHQTILQGRMVPSTTTKRQNLSCTMLQFLHSIFAPVSEISRMMPSTNTQAYEATSFTALRFLCRTATLRLKFEVFAGPIGKFGAAIERDYATLILFRAAVGTRQLHRSASMEVCELTGSLRLGGIAISEHFWRRSTKRPKGTGLKE